MLFLIWALFGVACAIAAPKKNRSAVGWFFAGLLLGPFGLIFILLLSKLPAPGEARQISTSPESMACLECGQRFQPWEDQCPECKAPLFPSVESPTEPRPSPGGEYKECPFCAETIKVKAIKCKHCGSMLEGESQAKG